MWGIRQMGKDYIKMDDIPKLKKYAVIAGLVLGVIAIIWSTISIEKKTTIELELKVGETINIGSVKVDFNEDGEIEGSNEHISCTANVDPVNKSLYEVKITGKSEGKATIKVTAIYNGEHTTYKYKIKVVE